jgi:dinuclear metal center YbgI/SA1388 family protein
MGQSIERVLAVLEEIAPIRLAEGWDNVGLLVPSDSDEVARILLTIDLTSAVVDEALATSADLIVAYHPPLFAPLKRFSDADPRHQSILRVIRAGIGVYSPHTALDAANGGLNDFLSQVFEAREVRPLVPSTHDPNVGAGRRVILERPLDVQSVTQCIEEHLGLDHLRVACPERPISIESIAICAGAGGALFSGIYDVDLFFTGEMRHHDVLEKVERGKVVILAEHTSTERVFLPRYAARLSSALGGEVSVGVARADREILVNSI